MRLARLDLIRFGRFEDTRLEVPAAEPDLVIVAGRNEAGKTTTMAAIEDLLFGFPARTGYAFRHGYDQLRVGAVIEGEGDRLVVRRRKGNRDTLLDEEEVPIRGGDGALARFFGTVDRAMFRRMFSLSHGRLAEGGRELAAAKGEVGETLFAAGAALRGFRARRHGLDREATDLWTPRRARSRRFYQASDRLDDLQRSLNQTIQRPDRWKALTKDRDAALAEKNRLEAEEREAATASRRWARIRRVLPTVRRSGVVEEELESLATVIRLPEDATPRLTAATAEAERSATEIRVHEEELNAKRRQRETIVVDPRTYERRDAVRELEAARVKVAQMRIDLPKRQGELESAFDDLRRAAADLGWKVPTAEALLERVPSARQVATLSTLLERYGRLEVSRSTTRTALQESEGRVTGQATRVSPQRKRGDAARLQAVLDANPGAEELDSRLRSAGRDRDERKERVQELVASLAPRVPQEFVGEPALRGIPAPNAEEIGRRRDRLRDLDSERETLHRELTDQQREFEVEQERQRNSEQSAPGITQAALAEARSDRDAAWAEVRVVLRGEPASGQPEAVADRFETLAAAADTVADRRFEAAEDAGRLREIGAAVQKRKAQLWNLEARLRSLDDEREAFLTEWGSLWAGCPFAPLAPASMLNWVATRDQLLEVYRNLSQAEREFAALNRDEREVRAQLAEALARFSFAEAELTSDALRLLVRRAENLLRDEEEACRREEEARVGLAKAEEERDRERERVRRAEEEFGKWQREWALTLEGAGLDPTSSPSGADTRLLADMRDAANRAREIQTKRIATMQRDIVRFEEDVRWLVADFGPDLEGIPPDEAALRMYNRLAGELDRRKELRELDRDIEDLERKIQERKAAGSRAEAALVPLYEAAGVDDRGALAAAIERSDRLRELEAERRTLRERLAQDGDGLSLDELRAECQGVGDDEARCRDAEAEASRAALQAKLNAVGEQLGETRKALEAFEDDDHAARLAAERQEALSAVREAAERYARVRSAEILLRWALERFRKENQGPMLRRAGRLFRTLTGGSFTTLTVGFDSKDQLQLEAVREGGEVVQVTGLSSGSEDQLYLALRVAAVEEYVERAPALPFIADDLFLNFDEERAAAGFHVLGDLAMRTQVLFFTHHEHLVEIAREVLGEDVPVIRLEEA